VPPFINRRHSPFFLLPSSPDPSRAAATPLRSSLLTPLHSSSSMASPHHAAALGPDPAACGRSASVLARSNAVIALCPYYVCQPRHVMAALSDLAARSSAVALNAVIRCGSHARRLISVPPPPAGGLASSRHAWPSALTLRAASPRHPAPAWLALSPYRPRLVIVVRAR